MNKLKYFENVFKVSLLIFLFLCGIMIEREVEAKNYRIEKSIVPQEELQTKKLIEQRVEGIEIYFDSITEENIVLVVKNDTGNKLQEVAVMNMKINGEKIESFSYLDGIQTGEIRKCSLPYHVNNSLKNTIRQITGDLYVRGSQNYFYQKLDLDMEQQ